MDAGDQITLTGLGQLPTGTAITLVASRAGYAVAAGPADRVRWLHTHTGQFYLFPTPDRAVAVLNACGIRRFVIDLTGGTPQ